jgi:hypothetical protein
MFVFDGSANPLETYNIFSNNYLTDKFFNVATTTIDPVSINIDPKLASGTFTPSYDSPAIDAGYSGMFGDNKFDYYGNPIYGTPDIGPIEYQPPYKMGTNLPDLSGNQRIYGDGKFRNKTSPSGKTAAFTLTPIGGYISTDKEQWMDLAFGSWNTNLYSWTASSSQSRGAQFSVSKLKAGGYYQIKVDNAKSSYITTSNLCDTNFYCKADSRGKIIFNYNGPWPTHVFSLIYGGLKYKPVSTLKASPSRTFTIYK